MSKHPPDLELAAFIGNKIYERRISHPRMSMQTLASRAGISPGTIVSLEHGRNLPNVATLYRIAEVLGVEIFSLLPGTEDIPYHAAAAYQHGFEAGQRDIADAAYQRGFEDGQQDIIKAIRTLADSIESNP